MMNLANKLTILRILIIPFVIACLIYNSFAAHITALVLFIIASVTDFADGYVARKYNLVTNFGKFTDPLADKLLTISVMIMFAAQGQMSAVATVIIVARELAVTGLRTLALEKGRVLAAAWSGKVKTCTQMAGLVAIMLANILSAAGVDFYQLAICRAISWIMAAVTLYSGLEYLVKNKDVILDKSN